MAKKKQPQPFMSAEEFTGVTDSWGLDKADCMILLGVCRSRYYGFRSGDYAVPEYLADSVIAHDLLGAAIRKKLLLERRKRAQLRNI